MSQKNDALAKHDCSMQANRPTPMLTLGTCIEQLQITPTVSHFQSLGFKAKIRVQFNSQVQVVLGLSSKTPLIGVSVMEPFGPSQK